MTTEEKAVLPPPSEEQMEALRGFLRGDYYIHTTIGEPVTYNIVRDMADSIQAMQETHAWKYLAVLAESLKVRASLPYDTDAEPGNSWLFTTSWQPVESREEGRDDVG